MFAEGFKGEIKNNKTLQVHSRLKANNKMKHSSCRTPFFSSFGKMERGSLTIEAAFVLPIFICMVCALCWLIMIFRLQVKIQSIAWDVAEQISGYLYVCEKLDNMTKEEEEYVKLKDTGIVRLGTSAISALYAQEEIQTALRTEEKYLCSLIKGGAEGISIDSILKIPDSDGVVDIVITYEADNPFLPGDIGDFDMIQRCYVKAWLGFDYKDEAEPDTTVYVTETGEVYHLSRECTYLKAKVLLAAYNMGLVKMGNKEYSPCQICMSDKWAENMSVFVYITEHGTKYHKDDSCSTLKRTVYEISLEEAVEKYDLCQRCEKEGKR